MILQSVRHPISCIWVCYTNDPQKKGVYGSAPALDLTTSLQSDFTVALPSHANATGSYISVRVGVGVGL